MGYTIIRSFEEHLCFGEVIHREERLTFHDLNHLTFRIAEVSLGLWIINLLH